jgi:CHAT domain-containing protein
MGLNKFLLTILIALSLLSFGQKEMDKLNVLSRNLDKTEAINYATKYIKLYSNSIRSIPYYFKLIQLLKDGGNLVEAEKQVKKLETWCVKNTDFKGHHLWYDGLDYCAQFYIEIGNFSKAEQLLKRSVEGRGFNERKPDIHSYSPYSELGQLEYYKENYDSAITLFSQYILAFQNSTDPYSKMLIPKFANCHFFLAQALEKAGRYDDALLIAKKNVNLQRHRWVKKEKGNNFRSIVASHLILARLRYDKQNYALALRDVEDALRVYKFNIGIKNQLVAPILILKGEILFAMGKQKDGIDIVKQGVEFELKYLQNNFFSLSEYEKVNFYKGIRQNINTYNHLVITQESVPLDSELSNVLYWDLNTKAIILNAMNKVIQLAETSPDKKVSDTYKNWKLLKSQYVNLADASGEGLQGRRRELIGEITELEKQLIQTLGDFKIHFKELADIQGKLKPNEAAIEIITIKGPEKSTYIAFIIKSEGNPEFIRLDEEKFLKRQFKFHQNAVIHQFPDMESYDVFWKPFKEKLPQAQRIYFSPDGIFNLLNLEILRNREGQYLGDESEIVNITSLKDLFVEPSTLHDLNGVLVGRPDYYTKIDDEFHSVDPKRSNIDGLIADLPGTENEIHTVEKILKDNGFESTVYLGKDADEHILKAIESQSILHFATHGFFNATENEDPMLSSGLLLAGAGDTTFYHGEDGVLTAYEASLLSLKNCQLVLLSACETGLGEVVNGEGVYGLQRAFKVANVNYIIMAMWKINDNATDKLISYFYEEMVRTKDVHASLRNAKVRLRQIYPDPYFWGAFKIIGI